MYHQRISARVNGVTRIIKEAAGITVTAIHKNTSNDLSAPIRQAHGQWIYQVA
jgi:hypothetical protein